GFDPVPTLRSLNVRGLWLLGLDDRSIPIRDTIRILDGLIKDGKPYRHVDFPGADHSLRGADIWKAFQISAPRRLWSAPGKSTWRYGFPSLINPSRIRIVSRMGMLRSSRPSSQRPRTLSERSVGTGSN